MIARINEFAPIIEALSVLGSFGFVIWATCFRKTRRDRMDELKVEMQVLLTQTSSFVLIKARGKERENKFFSMLDSKFQTPKYKALHRPAYNELTFEGKNDHINFIRALNQAIAKQNE